MSIEEFLRGIEEGTLATEVKFFWSGGHWAIVFTEDEIPGEANYNYAGIGRTIDKAWEDFQLDMEDV